MVATDLFSSFPDDARLWIYASAEPIPESDALHLLEDIRAFARRWTSHGRPVTSEIALVDRRFLLVAGYVAGDGVSGCGIDASVRALDDAASRHGIVWASSLDIFVRDDNGEVSRMSRTEFRRLAQEGMVDARTMVIDPSVTSFLELRAGLFEAPAERKWHRRLLKSAETSVP